MAALILTDFDMSETGFSNLCVYVMAWLCTSTGNLPSQFDCEIHLLLRMKPGNKKGFII